MNKLLLPAFAVIAVLIASPASVFGGVVGPITVNLGPNGESALIPIEMLSLDLVGGDPVTLQLKSFPIPLASDPTNALGDSIDGYGFVDSDVTLILSSQRDPGPGDTSIGYVQLIKTSPPAGLGPNTIQTGDEFQVDSFFDVFFDITITDVDPRPQRDYVGMPDGTTVTWPDVPTEDTVASLPSTSCTADTSLPLLGCIDGLLYVGNTPAVIELGVDVNGNGEIDVLKFNLHQLTLGGASYVLPGDDIEVTYPDSFFDIAADIGDLIDDPPFNIGLIPPGPDPPLPPKIILRPVPGALPELPGFPDDEDDDDGDGLDNEDDPNPNDPCDPNPFGPACTGQSPVAGEIVSINTTSLLVAGVQTNLAWMLGLVVSGIGISLVILRRK